MKIILLPVIIVVLLIAYLLVSWHRGKPQNKNRYARSSKPSKQNTTEKGSQSTTQRKAPQIIEQPFVQKEISADNVSSREVKKHEQHFQTLGYVDQDKKAESTLSIKNEQDVVMEFDEADSSGVDTQADDKQVSSSAMPEVLLLRVVADEDRLYLGTELSQIFTRYQVRYGQMSIYHYHASSINRLSSSESNSKASVGFSIAQVSEPGTLPKDMSQLHCKGLTLFMELLPAKETLNCFEHMLQFAETIADQLGGVVINASNQVLDAVIIHDLRQHVIEHSRI